MQHTIQIQNTETNTNSIRGLDCREGRERVMVEIAGALDKVLVTRGRRKGKRALTPLKLDTPSPYQGFSVKTRPCTCSMCVTWAVHVGEGGTRDLVTCLAP